MDENELKYWVAFTRIPQVGRVRTKRMEGHFGTAEVLRYVTYDLIHIDEINHSTELDISTVSGVLAMMELKGMVKQVGGMNYMRLKESAVEYQAV